MKITSIQAPNADFYCEHIAGYISDRLDLPVSFVTGLPWQERERMIDAGEVQVGWLCSLPYIWKADRPNPSIELLVAAIMEGERYEQKPVYFSDVVVRRGSQYKTFDDLKGAHWAYNEPNSHSGCNVVRYHLAILGELSGFFGAVTESGSHQDSLEMILDGRVHASAIDSTVLEIEIANHPSLRDRIRVIEILGPSPIPPWVVSRDLSGPLKDSLRTVFLEMHKNEAGWIILREAMIDRFVSVSDQNYDPIREMERIAKTVRQL
jgi:phosphonate transport system substrate-binding protein